MDPEGFLVFRVIGTNQSWEEHADIDDVRYHFHKTNGTEPSTSLHPDSVQNCARRHRRSSRYSTSERKA